MGEEVEVGCARPTGGPVGENQEVEPNQPRENVILTQEAAPMIKIGKKHRISRHRAIRQANLFPPNFRTI